MKVSYKWLQTFFKEGLPSAEELEQKLMFHAYEIEGVEKVMDDLVIDVDVLPNRSADSLSHRGIAREISTLFEVKMSNDPLRGSVELKPTTDSVSISLGTDASCSYYVAARITGVSVQESPQWLKSRLKAIGQKSINNVVDATNYVLFGLGQPTHIFDAAKFSGEAPHIGVRLAHVGEKLTLLGGDEVELAPSMSVIIDANNDRAIAIAGVKGGTPAEVTQETTDVIIESAKFDPVQTRKTSQALKIRTDASARYENDVPDKLVEYGVQAVAELIVNIAGGEVVGFTNAGRLGGQNKDVAVSTSQVSKLLGADIDTKEIENILKRLQFIYSMSGEEFTVVAPFERRDIKIPEDVIEEIGRIYGYSKIESKQLGVPKKEPAVHKKFAYAELVRNTLNKLSFTEVYLYSLRDSGEIKLLNSLASDKDHLRSNLANGISESLDKNERQMPLLGLYEAVQIFEIGNIFKKDTEETHVCLGVRVAGIKKREERTITVLTNAKDALEDALGVSLPEISGETLEFSLDKVVKDLPTLDSYPEGEVVGSDVSYVASSQYPFVLRDIAVWVPARTSSDDILEIIEKHGEDLLVRSDIFDEFSKDNKTSYAFHLVFQSYEKTLTDKEVGEIMQKIEADINTKEGWEVR